MEDKKEPQLLYQSSSVSISFNIEVLYNMILNNTFALSKDNLTQCFADLIKNELNLNLERDDEINKVKEILCYMSKRFCTQDLLFLKVGNMSVLRFILSQGNLIMLELIDRYFIDFINESVLILINETKESIFNFILILSIKQSKKLKIIKFLLFKGYLPTEEDMNEAREFGIDILEKKKENNNYITKDLNVCLSLSMNIYQIIDKFKNENKELREKNNKAECLINQILELNENQQNKVS